MFEYKKILLVFFLFAIFIALPPKEILAQGSGQKYALITAINDYPAPVNPLSGCVSDANKINDLLISKFDFPQKNVTLLLQANATRNGILNSIRNFSNRVKAGDTFVFYYSGHGTIFPDRFSEDQDEVVEITPSLKVGSPPGKYDSAIVPYDALSPSGKPWDSMILDDELYREFSTFTAKGCFVLLVADCCNAGTVARTLDNATVKYVSPEVILGKSLDELKEPEVSRELPDSRDFRGLYLALTAVQDEQVAIEVSDRAGNKGGLFTTFLIAVIEDKLREGGINKVTYNSVFPIVRNEVLSFTSKGANKLEQKPQIFTKYYQGSLDIPMFSAARTNSATSTGNSAPSQKLRVVVKVTNVDGSPLEKSAFCILKPGVTSTGSIKKEDTLLIGLTDNRGLFDTNAEKSFVNAGKYRIKVVRNGYRSYDGEIEIREGRSSGIAVLSFRLATE